MHNPPHPGDTLREDVLPELGLGIPTLARQLGCCRAQLSAVLHGRAAMTADLAGRLELAGVGRARMWLGQQSAYDLWQAQHRATSTQTNEKGNA